MADKATRGRARFSTGRPWARRPSDDPSDLVGSERRFSFLLHFATLLSGTKPAFPEALYCISGQLLADHSGHGLLHRYSSVPGAVMAEWPALAWAPWKFSSLPKSWFYDLMRLMNSPKSIENPDEGDPIARTVLWWFLSELAQKYRTQDWLRADSWDRVTLDPRDHKFVARLGSLESILAKSVPSDGNRRLRSKLNQFDWYRKQPAEYWKESRRRREFLDLVASPRRDSSPLSHDDAPIYQQTYASILESGGQDLLRWSNGSAVLAFLSEYPERSFMVWRFRNTLKGWWVELGHLFRAGDPIAEAVVELFILDSQGPLGPSSRRQFDYLGGKHQAEEVLAERRAAKAKEDLRPSGRRELFHQRQWKEGKNIREFLDTFSADDRIYTLSMRDLRQSGATNLGRYLGDNIYGLIRQQYPERAIQTWKFAKTPDNWWANVASLWKSHDPVAKAAVASYLDYIMDRFTDDSSPVVSTAGEAPAFVGAYAPGFAVTRAKKPKALETWYSILPHINYTTNQMDKVIVAKFGGLSSMLRSAYPRFNWSDEALSKHANTLSQEMLNKLATGLL